MLLFLPLVYSATETLVTELGPTTATLSSSSYVRIQPKPSNTVAFVTIENRPQDNLTRAENHNYPGISWSLEGIRGFIALNGTKLFVDHGAFETPVTVWILPSDLCRESARTFATYQYIIVNWQYQSELAGSMCFFPARQKSAAKAEIVLTYSDTIRSRIFFGNQSGSIAPMVETNRRVNQLIESLPFFIEVDNVSSGSVFSYRVEYETEQPNTTCQDQSMMLMDPSGEWTSYSDSVEDGIVCSTEQHLWELKIIGVIIATLIAVTILSFIFWGLAELFDCLYRQCTKWIPRTQRGFSRISSESGIVLPDSFNATL